MESSEAPSGNAVKRACSREHPIGELRGGRGNLRDRWNTNILSAIGEAGMISKSRLRRRWRWP